MSGTPHLEDLQKTLEEAGRQVGRELQEAERLRIDPETVIRQREQVLFESLKSAKDYYKKKEYARAFFEWERACSVLENDEFLRKVRALKESHENLLRANRELVETRQALHKRITPSPADTKFVDGSHQTVNTQVKNVYSHLSQQLRTERTPRAVSFLWPALLALAILGAGFAGLKAYHNKVIGRSAALSPEAVSGTPNVLDDTFLEAQRSAMERQVAGLKEDHRKEIGDIRRKAAESAKTDREKVIQLETGLKEAEARNSELERRLQALAEDNLSKDRTIASLT